MGGGARDGETRVESNVEASSGVALGETASSAASAGVKGDSARPKKRREARSQRRTSAPRTGILLRKTFHWWSDVSCEMSALPVR